MELMVPPTMLMDPLTLLEIQPPNVQDSATKYVHSFINSIFVQASIYITQDSTTLWPCMHYSPNGLWSINNAYDIHGYNNIVQCSLITHGVVCIVHASTCNVHGSIKIVYGSISILHGSMLIYHEFCLSFLAWFHHLRPLFMVLPSMLMVSSSMLMVPSILLMIAHVLYIRNIVNTCKL